MEPGRDSRYCRDCETASYHGSCRVASLTRDWASEWQYAMSVQGHSRPGRADSNPGHVRYAPKAEGNSEHEHVVSPFKLLAEDDPTYPWREQLLDAFDCKAPNRRVTRYSWVG